MFLLVFLRFEMFFTGGNGRFERNGGRFVYRQNVHEEDEEVDENNQRQRQRPGLGQFLPILMLLLMYVIPYIFNSKPLYNFDYIDEYKHERSTSRNNVIYYANDNFYGKNKWNVSL